MHEESINHIILHCPKTRALWVLFFSLFGAQWVLPTTVKATLLGWDGFFVGKKRKEVWRANPLCIFWTIWKARNKIAFEEEVLSIQRLKSSFVYFLWSEMKLFIKDDPSTLVDYIDWVGTHWGWGSFCISFLAAELFQLGSGGVFFFIYFEPLFLRLFQYSFSLLLIKKEKKNVLKC